MTRYLQDDFNATTGIIEQLVYAVFLQRLLNQDYFPHALETDFTTNSVDWNVSFDYEQQASLNISLQFVTYPYQFQMLIDRSGLDRRISSLNPLSVDTAAIPHNLRYPQNSFPVQNLPAYLNDDTDKENILERRIVALCLQIIAIRNWADRWNICCSNWILRTFSRESNLVLLPQLPSLTEIEATRDALILELTTGISFAPVLFDQLIFGQTQEPVATSTTEPGNATELAQALIAIQADPGTSSQNPYFSGSLLADLNNAASPQSQYGDSSPETQSPRKPDKPTLPNC